jgi:heme ABC exporter ATP-binding subunit CcmA
VSVTAAPLAPPGETAVLEAAGLVRRFGGTVVVQDVGLRLERGQVALLLGANGAGKSTLLRLLAGLLAPDAGAVRIAGHDLARQRRRATVRLGYVGHAPLLYRDLSAEENLTLFARLYGWPAPVAARRAGALLEEVGLPARRRERVRALSQGQRQRLALARALVHEPPVLLLDEPFTALDAAGRDWLAARLRADRGRTVLLATHQPDLAPAAADRVFRIEGGRLREEHHGRTRWPSG